MLNINKIVPFIKSKSNARPLRTIEREMEETQARYKNYLETTSDSYSAQRGDVIVKNPHTMVADSYKTLRNSIDSISNYAKKENKAITFEDARVLIKDDEFVSPSTEDDFGSNVLITVKDKSTGKKRMTFVNYFRDPETPFMKKISNKIGELVSGKKDANIDRDLGIENK